MEHRHPNDPNRRFYGAVTVSERGQVVIPAEARRDLGIEVEEFRKMNAEANPVKRVGHPEDIAAAVAFLCSDDGGFVTGSTMSINGGQHMY